MVFKGGVCPHKKTKSASEWKEQIGVGVRLYSESWKNLRPQDSATEPAEGKGSEGAASPLLSDEQKRALVGSAKEIAATGKVAFDSTSKEIKDTDFRKTALEWLVVFRESSTAFLEGFRDGKAEEVRHNVNFAESFRNAFEKISTEIEKTKK